MYIQIFKHVSLNYEIKITDFYRLKNTFSPHSKGLANYVPEIFKAAATSHPLPTLPNYLTEEQDNYFLLCDVLPEDRLLREQLQQKRLVRNYCCFIFEVNSSVV